MGTDYVRRLTFLVSFLVRETWLVLINRRIDVTMDPPRLSSPTPIFAGHQDVLGE